MVEPIDEWPPVGGELDLITPDMSEEEVDEALKHVDFGMVLITISTILLVLTIFGFVLFR